MTDAARERGLRLAAASVVSATGALIVTMDWCPTPLNRNIAHLPVGERLPGAVVHGSAAALAVLLIVRGPRWVQVLVPVWFTTVLTSAVLNWWVPYLLGRYPGEIAPSTYLSEYVDNLRVLPEIGDHVVVPDVQHTVIHSLVAASALLSGAVVLSSWRRRG